jgi:acyl-CoA reductase-like NAD-dependent aldehyde dehydrogenase
MSAAKRSRIMYKLADLMEETLEALAQLETLDNGKPIRETMNADTPLAMQVGRLKLQANPFQLVDLSLTIHAMKQ